ncbi:hypothetical protein [Actinomadura opuntiae]|uniref:hypothetical protein n=1 Tax=Actinomadura sp. OS1-43 TaxID=604315 RepID=UPI00255AC470|nr:hypothetical protein [Actinomadura sp. OS1-43]MDL4817683.1 hypothetical protein [Actinomadura sp. OS1-43]
MSGLGVGGRRRGFTDYARHECRRSGRGRDLRRVSKCRDATGHGRSELAARFGDRGGVLGELFDLARADLLSVSVPDLVQPLGVLPEALFEILQRALQLGVGLLERFEVRRLDVREEGLDGQVVVLGRVTVTEGSGADTALVRVQCQCRLPPRRSEIVWWGVSSTRG